MKLIVIIADFGEQLIPEFNLLFWIFSSFDLQLNFGMIYSTGMMMIYFWHCIYLQNSSDCGVKMILINVF